MATDDLSLLDDKNLKIITAVQQLTLKMYM